MTEHPVEIPDLPSEASIDRLVSLLEPLSRVIQPKLYGVERLPADGSLLVGNHTIYGLIDVPFMMAEIWKHRRLPIRGLGEHAHYAVPLWREVLTVGGMVRGTRDNVRALMREGQTILVFPGGAREVNKHRGQEYQLLWRERIGFARLAIEQGYPIVPFAAVGADDMLDVLIDQNTPVYGQLSRLYEKLLGFPTPPVVRGIGLTPIPRPERLYFWFGEPIDSTRFGRQHNQWTRRFIGQPLHGALSEKASDRAVSVRPEHQQVGSSSTRRAVQPGGRAGELSSRSLADRGQDRAKKRSESQARWDSDLLEAITEDGARALGRLRGSGRHERCR